MKVIALIAMKGGAGKTTLAINLALASHLAGKSTALIDLDTVQHSASDWATFRQSAPPPVIAGRERDLSKMLEAAHKGKADLVIIDTPPHTTSAMVTVANLSDLVLIPTKPSLNYVNKAPATIEVIKTHAKRLSVVMCANAPLSYDAQRTKETLQLLHVQPQDICPITLTDYASYDHATNRAKGVQEYDPQGQAARDIQALYKWALSVA